MDPDRARELLAARRAQIESDLADLGRPLSSRDEDDRFEPVDAGPDLLDAEVSRATAEPLREELEAIAGAERRLDEGSYGVSVESGEQIPDARLEAIPWAERTEEEQVRYDAPAG
jgi:DnaK suppressor protein